MDMGSSIMSMTTATSTSVASTAASTMAMDMDMSASCKVSMLWNWHTIDACFISESWHIKSSGMFAGSCVGVILLVLSLEALRRFSKEYDRLILRQHQRAYASIPIQSPSPLEPETCGAPKESPTIIHEKLPSIGSIPPFRPNTWQQAVRATFHMLQFAVAYFVMLLAMYYNGYIIICIIIGAWLGAFIFNWETVNGSGPQEETSVCCG